MSSDLTEITVPSPSELERMARVLQGPLARAIGGGKHENAVQSLFLGTSNIIPSTASWLFRTIVWANRQPRLWGGPLRFVGSLNNVCGSLITTILFFQKGATDTVVILSDANGMLRSACLKRANHEHVEFRLTTDETIEEVLYFGRTLADGAASLVLPYRYDAKLGALRSKGPDTIREANLFSQPDIVLPDHVLTAEIVEKFTRLTGQTAAASLTFPANSGGLQPALQILQDRRFEIDFHRLVVHSLEFTRAQDAVLSPQDRLQIRFKPVAIETCNKGQLLAVLMTIAQTEMVLTKTLIRLLIRGNSGKPPVAKLPHLSLRNWKKLPGHQTIELRLMDDAALAEFASLNGDHNPLHQVDGVAQMAGFQGKICPGFGIIAQIEASLGRQVSGKITKLTGTFIRAGYPGQSYFLDFAPQGAPGEHIYQLRRPGKDRRLVVDGTFVLQ